MTELIEKPDMRYILHINSDKKIEKRLIDFCLESVVDVFEDTGLTADLNPVKLGRWIWDSNAPHREHGAYKCSNCGCHSYFEENYCYNCGARMDDDME